MTTVAVLADPPHEGVVFQHLVAENCLSEAEAAALYRAMLGDVCEAVARSGGDLLVNYRQADQLPSNVEDPEAEVRSAVRNALSNASEVRFEIQVGSTFSARAGNTVTHLLEREGVQTAAVVTPTAAFLRRQHVDSAAMKLRRSDVVVGASTDGRVYYAGFGEPIDFTDAYAPPAVETLVDRSIDAGLSVDFLPVLPSVDTTADLRTAVPLLRARRAADRQVPPRTAAEIDSLGLRVVAEDGEPRIVRK